MENSTHKGTELNNVKETGDQNERNLQNSNSGSQGNIFNEEAQASDLEQLIKQEANEYDNTNKEDRVLGGDRATLNDDENGVLYYNRRRASKK